MRGISGLRTSPVGHEGGNPGYRQGMFYRVTAPALDPVPPVYSSGLILLPFYRVVSQPRYMFKWLGIIFGTVGAAICCRYDLATENLALRQQLAVMKYQRARPRLTGEYRHPDLTPRRRRFVAWAIEFRSRDGSELKTD